MLGQGSTGLWAAQARFRGVGRRPPVHGYGEESTVAPPGDLYGGGMPIGGGRRLPTPARARDGAVPGGVG